MSLAFTEAKITIKWTLSQYQIWHVIYLNVLLTTLAIINIQYKKVVQYKRNKQTVHSKVQVID